MNKRRGSIDIARQSFNAASPRQGRVIRQVKRAFVVKSRPTMKDLRRWAYPNQPLRHWHYWSIYRALRRLGMRHAGNTTNKRK